MTEFRKRGKIYGSATPYIMSGLGRGGVSRIQRGGPRGGGGNRNRGRVKHVPPPRQNDEFDKVEVKQRSYQQTEKLSST